MGRRPGGRRPSLSARTSLTRLLPAAPTIGQPSRFIRVSSITMLPTVPGTEPRLA